MQIADVQERLAQLGYLDPPADGMWGPVSSWALAQVMGGPVQDEAVTSLAVEAALMVAKPLPLQADGDDLAARIVRAGMAIYGAWFCRHPDAYTIAYVEGANLDGEPNGNVPNQFNDMRSLIQFDAQGVPHFATIPGGGVAKWTATTEPSKYWTENPMSPGGAARVALGQQKAWVMGEYHGEPAVRQAGELTIYRDPDMRYRRYGPTQRGSSYGIHHHADYNYPKNNLGRSSAGCLVGWNLEGHRTFCAMLRNDPRYRASHAYRFAALLLSAADILITKPAPVPTPAPEQHDGEVAVSRRCSNVWMTVFAGRSRADGGYDPETSAYTGKPIDPNVIGFSVSDRFAQPRPWVRCWVGDRSIIGQLVDVGPGLTNDPWWEDPDGRPGAHNGAGLDATPAAWRALGLDPTLGKVRVDFQLFREPQQLRMVGGLRSQLFARWRPQE